MPPKSGSVDDVTLAKARDAAADARALIRDRKDPIEERRQERTAAKVEASRAVTFKTYAEQFISGREGAWKNPRHRQAWRNSMRDYAYPTIGQMPIADVDTAAVLRVLRPIWSTKTETASRVRGRIEAILSAAKVEGLPTGDDPPIPAARLKGGNEHTVPLTPLVTPVRLPPGRLRLATRPSETGSVAVSNTIGIVAVAAFAASDEGVPPAAITVTFRGPM
jgi:hypothetical protein